MFRFELLPTKRLTLQSLLIIRAISLAAFKIASSAFFSNEYLYNKDGQLKEKRSGGRRLISYAYDKAGQITELTDPAGVTTCYEYDLLGRASRIYSREGMEVKYTYDSLDRPEHITYGNGLETVYGYDADSRVTHLETRHGDEILLSFRYEYDGNGNRISKTGIQPGITGTDYATAGSCLLESEEKLFNRIRYAGQQYDQVTEQYYLRARYYTPALGRFLQEDVYPGRWVNLYAYCGNNPVVYCDPSGYKKAKTPCEVDELGDSSGDKGVEILTNYYRGKVK